MSRPVPPRASSVLGTSQRQPVNPSGTPGAGSVPRRSAGGLPGPLIPLPSSFSADPPQASREPPRPSAKTPHQHHHHFSPFQRTSVHQRPRVSHHHWVKAHRTAQRTPPRASFPSLVSLSRNRLQTLQREAEAANQHPCLFEHQKQRKNMSSCQRNRKRNHSPRALNPLPRNQHSVNKMIRR